MKIISFIWFLSVLTFSVADVRTGALKDKDVELRCYSCPHVENTTDCNSLEISQVRCTPEQPYCGTTAKSPDYTSSLACTSGEETPCTLIQTAKDAYEMTCMCDNHLCNKPFTREFRNELLNFSPTNLSDYTTTRLLLEQFINSSIFANVTTANLYKAITLPIQETKNLIAVPLAVTNSSAVVPNTSNNVNAPRAEALKHEATLPSDDDEDEGEGSGIEDVKPQVPAAPAAPSSFLPANENRAIPLNINFLATIPFISLYTVA